MAHHLDPRARSLWSVLAGAATGIAALVGGIALIAVGAWFVAIPLVLAAVVGGALYARAAWARWTWADQPEALELAHGVVIRRASYVPYHRIQQIDIARGPIDRWLGLAKLIVRTASATTDATIPGLAVAEANRVRQHLLERAGVDDAV